MTTFVTLGPDGTDHHHTLARYLEFHQIRNATVRLVDDFTRGLELTRTEPGHFLLQNSAHPEVAAITTRYWASVRVVDAFVAPTKTMAILRRREVERPRTLAVMPATLGYLKNGAWDELIHVRAKPLIGQGLLDGKYEAGLTHLSWAQKHPDRLAVVEEIGPVDTAWIVYTRRESTEGHVVGAPRPDLYPTGPDAS